jgi:hypothetical protein
MLAKPGPRPIGVGWLEPKWDGFRAIIRSGDRYCVRSQSVGGWQAAPVAAGAAVPAGAALASGRPPIKIGAAIAT